MDHKWVRCDDIDVAAAFATLGVPITPKSQVRTDNGKKYTTFYLATESVVRPELKTAQLMRMLKDGTLKTADPEHPLLYALEGIKNYHAAARAADTGEPTLLVTRKGTKRCAYISQSANDKTLSLTDRFLKGHNP